MKKVKKIYSLHRTQMPKPLLVLFKQAVKLDIPHKERIVQKGKNMLQKQKSDYNNQDSRS